MPERLPTIRDSIHRTIPVEPFVADLIATPQLQRLRRIRQLGGVYLVYPGANHTRFEHALGAYALGRKVAHTLGLEGEDARVVMAGALLHDVGHGPFSHTSEEMLVEVGRRHEDLTVDLVRWSTLSSVLDKHDIPVDRVVAAVLGKDKVGPLVSGDLDVDRMDYLARDAYHCGVEMSIDAERIANGLQLEGGELVLDGRSLAAAEGLFVTRFMMYPTVYIHHTCRSIERMIVEGIRSLHEAGRLKVEDLERLDDARLIARMLDGPKEAAEMGRRIEERVLYKRALEGRMAAARDAGLLRLAKDHGARRGVETEIAARAGVAPHEVLLDVPQTQFMKSVGIRVRSRDRELIPFEAASSIAAGLQRATEDHWRFWVFTPPRHRRAVHAAALAVLGVEDEAVVGPGGLGDDASGDAVPSTTDPSLTGQTRL